jgi:hypothetical protein
MKRIASSLNCYCVFLFRVARSKLDPTSNAQQPSWALVFFTHNVSTE